MKYSSTILIYCNRLFNLVYHFLFFFLFNHNLSVENYSKICWTLVSSLRTEIDRLDKIYLQIHVSKWSGKNLIFDPAMFAWSQIVVEPNNFTSAVRNYDLLKYSTFGTRFASNKFSDIRIIDSYHSVLLPKTLNTLLYKIRQKIILKTL